ncbi:glycosyltransferase [Caulobacter soli]|uniref:glycosyltransferase n=1 Tax=Caulobacter soli TaxID=2708539 RepID=UPI0013ECFBBA|nr:glycosyltransferase [Caulobacter soli]
MMKQQPRVYHGPFNIAGIPGILAKTEREIGLSSRAICFPAGVYQRDVDQTITSFTADHALSAMLDYDIFNFHFGYSLWGDGLEDIRFLKMAGKKVVMHFHGCDIRDSKVVQRKYPINACQACWPMACNRNRLQAREVARGLGRRAVVYTPDIQEFAPNATFLPQPVDLQELDAEAAGLPVHERDPDVVRIVHAPSALDLKGSVHLQNACERLAARGVKVDLRLMTQRTHAEVMEEIANADLVVDQLLAGAYGVFAVEAMARGVPTLGYIRDDLRDIYSEDLPMISATPYDIESILLQAIERRSDWEGIGRRSRAYVEARHDRRVVSPRLIELYS